MKIRFCVITAIILAVLSCEKAGEDVTVFVDPTSLSAPYGTSSQSFELSSNGEWTLKVLSPENYDISWARPSRTGGNGNATISVRIYENEYQESRVAKLVATSTSGQTATVILTQEGNPNSDKHNNQAQIRVGTYNVRGDWAKSDTGENAWDNRKDRLVRSIQDCDFDVFGVNECGFKTRAYIEEKLGDVYEQKLFNPYSQTGSGERCTGILYKKDVLALKEFHYFWLWEPRDKLHLLEDGHSASPVVLGIFTHIATGLEFYFIAAHGPAGYDYRMQYANFYEQLNKDYNPNDNPAFFVGDLNCRPDDDVMPIWERYWTDTREVAPVVEGAYATYSAWKLDRDMYVHASRIDYIFYRNAIPLKYVDFDTSCYDGYYASDHLPQYADVIIRAGN